MNGKNRKNQFISCTFMQAIMKYSPFYILWAGLIVFIHPPALAGNKGMIENRIQELNDLNKDAIEQIANIPGNAVINIKAKARPYGQGYSFDIDEKKISPIKEHKIGSDTGVYNKKAVDIKEEKFESNITKSNSEMNGRIVFDRKQRIDTPHEGEGDGDATNNIKSP
jgi:hypothetical protein